MYNEKKYNLINVYFLIIIIHLYLFPKYSFNLITIYYFIVLKSMYKMKFYLYLDNENGLIVEYYSKIKLFMKLVVNFKHQLLTYYITYIMSYG